ncbi:MAG TPA: hypothetical protein VJ302_18945 [Blastocatellia bacterium]|nr:hypothetical protein [Blastocatellia bacterium]
MLRRPKSQPGVEIFILTEAAPGRMERPIGVTLDEQSAQDWCNHANWRFRRWHRCRIPLGGPLTEIFFAERGDDCVDLIFVN